MSGPEPGRTTGIAAKSGPAATGGALTDQATAAGWLGVAAAVLLAVSAPLLALSWSASVLPLATSHPEAAAMAIAFFAWSALGSLILRRRSRNRVGLVLLVAGICGQAWVLLAYYASYGLAVRPGLVPAAEAAAWAAAWLPIVAFGLAFTFLFLLFPDGRLPSARWRPIGWFAAATVVFAAATWATDPEPLGTAFADARNPTGLDMVARLDLTGVGWGLYVLAVLGSATAAVVRLRRSSGAERQQLTWFAYAAALVGLAWVTVTVGSSAGGPFTTVSELMLLVVIFALPLAVFIAVFKHHLYDIELVLSRTIVVGVLAVLVTGGYVAVVAGVGTAIGRAGEVSMGLAVVATALVAVVFQPVRVRAQRLANRLVYGERATPYGVLTALARKTGDTYDAGDLLPYLARTLAEATGASRVDVWLLADRRLHCVTRWPVAGERPASVPVTDEDEPPTLPGVSEVAAVRHQGALVGALSMTLPLGHGLRPVERRLLADLAAQVGVALDNIRLVEELKASRQRILAAQDEERRRIERDIHDGVQQRLVALSLALRMAGAGARTAPDGAMADALEEAAEEARAALAELRRLARGIHPAIVSEGGLAAALDSLAERSPVPTAVLSVPEGRLAASVEVTVYYLVAEALANVAKHAHASTARVSVDRVDSAILVEVADDGIGGAAPGTGSGLSGLADRVAALSGTFAVESPSGQGTRLRAVIPCASS